MCLYVQYAEVMISKSFTNAVTQGLRIKKNNETNHINNNLKKKQQNISREFALQLGLVEPASALYIDRYEGN